MEKEKVLEIGSQLKGNTSVSNFIAYAAEFKNLILTSYGKNNPFYEAVDKIKITAPQAIYYLDNLITSFLRAVENDLISSVSYHRKIKIEVVRDYLTQAEQLAEMDEFHPATAVVLAGASLEEFLRNWVENESLLLEVRSPSIDSYAKALRKNELINKQDLKDITAWAGLRNDAAHGNWLAVMDRGKVSIMIKGISLFVRQYST